MRRPPAHARVEKSRIEQPERRNAGPRRFCHTPGDWKRQGEFPCLCAIAPNTPSTRPFGAGGRK